MTGVAINTDSVRAPKDYKKKLFQSLYYIEKYGLNSHMAKLKIRNPHYLDTMLGKLNYVLSIEKENIQAIEYKTMLLDIDKRRTHNRVYKG